VSDDEWALVAPYLTLLPEDMLQRRNPLQHVFIAFACILLHRVAPLTVSP
jgi:hypothetical protein